MEQNISISDYLKKMHIYNGEKFYVNTNANKFPLLHDDFTPNHFWKLFLLQYEIVNQKKFVATETNKSFVFTLIYYFLRFENFYKSTLLYNVDNCEVALDKGLLIVGSFGVGKTSIAKTIVSIIENLSLNHYSNPVRMHNSLQLVEEFESSPSECRNEIITKYSKGFRIFDDVKNEREASNFGKVELFREILYKRCENKNYRTILLSNYDSEHPNDMAQAIDSFGRYGDRVYGRLFESFNFIEFKGKSMRK